MSISNAHIFPSRRSVSEPAVRDGADETSAAHEMTFSTLPSGGTCVQPGFGAPPLGWDSKSEVLTTHLRAFGPVWLLQGQTRRLPPTYAVGLFAIHLPRRADSSSNLRGNRAWGVQWLGSKTDPVCVPHLRYVWTAEIEKTPHSIPDSKAKPRISKANRRNSNPKDRNSQSKHQNSKHIRPNSQIGPDSAD